MIKPYIYPSEKEVAIAITERLIHSLKTTDQPLYIALSGGSTPNALFALWGKEYAKKIPWQRIHLFWVDERCVPPSDPESNFGNMKILCLDYVDIPIENIHRIQGENNPAAEAERYINEVQQIIPVVNGIPQFDIILAGMGNDGHTSSIFPGQTHLFTKKQAYVVSFHPVTHQVRIAMTGPVMMAAKELIFHVIGTEKQHLIHAMLHPDPATENLPAIFIARHANNTLLFTDKE